MDFFSRRGLIRILVRITSPLGKVTPHTWRHWTHLVACGFQPIRRSEGPRWFPAAAVDESVLQLRLQLAESTDKLDLADCGLTEVPPEVFRLPDLQRPGVAPRGVPEGQSPSQNILLVATALFRLATWRRPAPSWPSMAIS